MIIVKLMGGLGNQLQQYALYRHVEECGLEAALDTGWFDPQNQASMLAPRKIEINRFPGIRYKVATDKDIELLLGSNSFLGKCKRRFIKDSVKKFSEDVRPYADELYNGLFVEQNLKDLYIEGYFSNEYYYSDILPILRSELEFPIEEAGQPTKIAELSQKMLNGDSISVHLRRGDYLDSANTEGFGNICTDEYYVSALNRAIAEAIDPKVYVFSDDLEFTADYFNKMSKVTVKPFTVWPVDINKGEDNFFDIYLMSCCKTVITANSTFSFWGGRLNSREDKVLIRPTIHHNKQTFEYENMKKWWKDWIFVSPEGEVFE